MGPGPSFERRGRKSYTESSPYAILELDTVTSQEQGEEENFISTGFNSEHIEYQRLLNFSSESEDDPVDSNILRKRKPNKEPLVKSTSNANFSSKHGDSGLEDFMKRNDSNLPGLTFRFWVLSIFFSVLLAFTNQFFFFRDTPLNIGGFIVQLLAFPLGVFMAKVLPTRPIKLLGFSFSLNPGEFNVKEHGLISVCAGACAGTAYAMDIIVVKKMFYKQSISIIGSLLLLISTQFMGYGFAGIYKRFLIRPIRMVWPSTLVSVAVFQTLHEGKSSVRSLRKFFILVSILSFFYYFIPGYLFTLVSTISFLCLFFPNNKMAQQLGSGVNGLGIGAVSLDWNAFTSYIGSPLVTPFWAQVNTIVGYVLVCWILVPIGYYFNAWDALKFPIFSAGLFDKDGGKYDRLRITPDNVFSESEYQAYSPLRLSFYFAFTYGVCFSTLTALITHTVLYHGTELYQGFYSYFDKKEQQEEGVDPHALVMDKYPDVPVIWYLLIFIFSLIMALFAVGSHGLDLPWWALLLAVGISFVFTLPIGIVTAITNQTPGLNILTEFIAGYMLPGRPMANITFKVYGYVTMLQALTFLSDLKLGQYLKIPPRQMLFAQCLGTLIAAIVNLATAEWLMDSVPNICTPEGFPWTCPSASVFYSASVIWGLIGPAKMFGPGTLYYPLLSAFGIGLLLPIPFYLLSRKFPNHSWLRYIHIPIVVSATSSLPPARPGIFLTWFVVGFIFHILIKRKYFSWYTKYTMILSAALDTGVALSAMVIFFLFEQSHHVLAWWGNDPDFHCPLASSPGT